jgi:DNA-binding response OmpR family regulator
MEQILVVEDDRTVQKALKRLFESEGYSVDARGNGRSALEAFYRAAPAAIVLDLGLPIMSGRDVCREIRQQSLTVPIIILSARSDVREKISLLELGADDYVTKPFSPRELLARVRAAIRYTPQADAQATTTFDSVCVHFTKMEVTLEGRPVPLTSLEFKILRFFVQNAERVVSREELLREVFGYREYPRHTINDHIFHLRQKLEKDPDHPVHFCTVRGFGYKFIR